MSTSLDNDTDLTVIENLDFEPGCDCIWHEQRGESAPSADWTYVRTPCPGCGRSNSFACDPCFTEIQRRVASFDGLLRCSICKTRHEYRIIWAERINGS